MESYKARGMLSLFSIKVKCLFIAFLAIFSSLSIGSVLDEYFYNIVFLNGLPLSKDATAYCDGNKDKLSDKYKEYCTVFGRLYGKNITIKLFDDGINKVSKTGRSSFNDYSDEDFSLYNIDVYSKAGDSFSAILDTASYISLANVEPNLYSGKFKVQGPYKDEISVGLALIDINTTIAGMGNKIVLTQERDAGILGVDFIGQYDQFSLYSDGIEIQPSSIECDENCVSYDATFDGENLHFFYPIKGQLQRVSFETGSPISTVPFSVEGHCVAEDVDFSELAERGLDVGHNAKLCKQNYKFDDYTMMSSVVTQTSREIDGEPLPVMGMNMINAFDHVTLDLPAGKIYFYYH